MPHALAVDDDPNFLSALAELIEGQGFTTNTACTLRDARTMVSHRTPDVALVDLYLPDGSGIELLKDLELGASTEVVLMTGHADVESAVQALRLGASDYLTKPLVIGRLKSIVATVGSVQPTAQAAAPVTGTQEVGRLGLLLGASPPMQALYEMLNRVAPTDASVFLIGESGTGKDLAAQTLHLLSRRSKAPFLPLNCGAISPTLIESELFGHERGSFTGAERRHKGYFERANRGTLFLDEIAEMPIELQAKLLRVLETGSFMRVGGEEPLSVDVRVIAASNRGLQDLIGNARLRDDLDYHLKVFQLSLPPRRERAEDVPLLAQSFLDEFMKFEGTHKCFSEAALRMLCEYWWPGNVRELRNVVHSAHILAGNVIEVNSLPSEVHAAGNPPTHQDVGVMKVKIGTPIAAVERDLVMATLRQCNGNKAKTAELLGVSLKTLYNRLIAYRA